MYLKGIVNNRKYIDFIALLIPLTFFYITTRFKILNPKRDGWLSDGDGTVEIAWEFFRNSSFPYWLIGNLEDYGSEMARPSFYTLPTFYALPLRFFSSILGERFQFIGIVILLNLILHYYIALKIFKVLKFTKIEAALASTMMLTAPILHYRYLDHTHYLLSSNWILLLLIYLVLKRDYSYIKWGILTISSLLIFPYYALFVVSVGIIFFIFGLIQKTLSVKDFFIIAITNFLAVIISLISSGYIFFGNILVQDAQLGFDANLNSLIDPSGWSRILRDRPEMPGNYEGFAFLGANFLILALVTFFYQIAKLVRNQFKINLNFNNFFILGMPAFGSFLLAMSETIYWDEKKLFDLDYGNLLNFIEISFRSNGRFIWLPAYLIMIYLIYKLHYLSRTKIFIFTLIVLIIFGLWDTWPKLISQNDARFAIKYENPLRSNFWKNISSCYNKIISVPPVTTAEFLYPISKIAYSQKMAVYPAIIPRVPAEEQFIRQIEMRKSIRAGDFEPQSIYLFQEAKFVLSDITEVDKNIAVNTMPKTSRAGSINGVFVVAPYFEKCHELNLKYASKLNFTKQFSFDINGELDFAGNPNSKRILISGWSEIENWGVWSSEDQSEIIIQRRDTERTDAIKVTGQMFEFPDGTSPEMDVYVNGKLRVQFNSDSKLSDSFLIVLESTEKNLDTFFLEFKFRNLKSPREVSNFNDDRKLGFGLKQIAFTNQS